MARQVPTMHLPGQLSLFDLCGDPSLIQAGAIAVRAAVRPAFVPEAGAPVDVVLRELYGPALSTPTPLAAARRERRREQAEADLVAATIPPPTETPSPRRPSSEDVAYVERAIRDALPKSVPSYAKEVLGIRKGRGVMVIHLRLFDDEIGVLRLSGVPGAHGYGWDAGERDPRPFHWDEDARAWVRIEEPDG